jgi:hypothetical protein
MVQWDEQQVRELDQRVAELRAVWQEFRRAAQAAFEEVLGDLSTYRLLDTPHEDRFELELFGMHWFVRFRHDFSDGMIDYGVVKRSDERPGRLQRVVLCTYRFDLEGNLETRVNAKDPVEAGRLHIRTLRELSRKAVKLTEPRSVD